MWVCMKQPFNEHLLQVSAKEFLRERFAVHVQPRQWTELRYFGAVHKIHREHR